MGEKEAGDGDDDVVGDDDHGDDGVVDADGDADVMTVVVVGGTVTPKLLFPVPVFRQLGPPTTTTTTSGRKNKLTLTEI